MKRVWPFLGMALGWGVVTLFAQSGPVANVTSTTVMRGTKPTLAVSLLDASGNAIASFGAGTQYTEGDTDATITGTALLWEDAGNALATVSAGTPLPVTATVTGAVDTEFPAAVAVGDNLTPANTSASIVWMYRWDGTNWDRVTSTEVVEDVAETGGASGPLVLGVRRDTAASSAGASGDNATVNTDASGLLWTRFLDPCSGVAKSYIPIDITTATTTELTTSLAGASNHYYICGLNLVTAAANNVSLVDDDTDNCASVTSAIVGGLTAAEGWNLGANGGLAVGTGNGSVMRTNGTNRVLCLVTSAATQLAGHIVVAAAP